MHHLLEYLPKRLWIKSKSWMKKRKKQKRLFMTFCHLLWLKILKIRR